jgi:prepilin-type N-terminal cleavage/methylation domain-containing protein
MRSRSRQGFTIIEVVVAAGIFALLAGLVTADLHSAGRLALLNGAANELAANIRSVQGLAYSNAPQEICNLDSLVCKSGSTCDSSYPTNCVKQAVSYYGIKLDTDASHNKYLLGADYNNSGTYGAAETIPTGLVTLPKNIVFNSVTPAVGATVYDLSYAYNPTNASPFVTCSSNCTTTVVLKDTQSNATKTIVIQKVTGVVYVQ